jgi:hypothetical protein
VACKAYRRRTIPGLGRRGSLFLSYICLRFDFVAANALSHVFAQTTRAKYTLAFDGEIPKKPGDASGAKP